MSRTIAPLTLLLLVSCTQDAGVAFHNNPPDVAFVLPADGSWAYAGVPMDFVATITDDITANEDLTTQWTSTIDGYIVGEETIEGEALTLHVTEGLSIGEHVITLQLVDGEGETAEDSVTVEMVQNSAPTCSFIKPQQGEVFALGDVIPVLAYVQDVEDTENLDLMLFEWEGTMDLSGAPEYGTSSGQGRFDLVDVPAGSHSISYRIYDLAGDSSSASVSFSVE